MQAKLAQVQADLEDHNKMSEVWCQTQAEGGLLVLVFTGPFQREPGSKRCRGQDPNSLKRPRDHQRPLHNQAVCHGQVLLEAGEKCRSRRHSPEVFIFCDFDSILLDFCNRLLLENVEPKISIYHHLSTKVW